MSRREVRFLRALISLLIAAIWLAAPAWGQEAEVAVVRASALARQGHCPEALQVLARVSRANGAVARLRGQCQLELRDYPAAAASLEEAKRLEPGLPDVDLLLAMARFHQGDLVGSEAALDAAAATSGKRSEYHLYRGLILLQEAQASAAASELQRAQETAPGPAEPTTSYYAGLAWAASDQRERAEQAFDRVIAAAPDSVWATEARKAKEKLAHASVASWWAWARGGIEYDNNVVLRGTGVTLPRDISGQGDWRGVWTLSGGYELLRTPKWSAGVTGTYYGAAQSDLSTFDQHNPVLGAWLDRRLGEATTLRLRVDAGYAWVDQSPFVASQTFGPELYHDWGEAGRSKLYVSAAHRDYFFSRGGDVPAGPGFAGGACVPPAAFCGPPGINERRELDRDGWGVTVGADHAYQLVPARTELSGGYRFHTYDSRGSEYQFDAHEVWLGTKTRLPWDLELRLYGSYAHSEYDNPSVFPSPRDVMAGVQYALQGVARRDNTWRFRVALEKFWVPRFSTSIAFSRLDNKSNVDVYDYDRNIVGAYVTYRFGR